MSSMTVAISVILACTAGFEQLAEHYTLVAALRAALRGSSRLICGDRSRRLRLDEDHVEAGSIERMP